MTTKEEDKKEVPEQQENPENPEEQNEEEEEEVDVELQKEMKGLKLMNQNLPIIQKSKSQ